MPEMPAVATASARPSRRRVPWWLVAMLPLCLVAGLVTGRWLDSSGARLEAFRQLPLVGVVVGIPLTLWVVLFVHEAGHLLAARAQGWPFLLLLVGPLRVVRGATGLAWGLNRAWPTWGGLTASIPPVDHTFRRQMLLMAVSGPLASAALGLMALWLSSAGGRLAPYALVGGATSLLVSAATLLPMKSGGFQSDGAQALDLIRSPEESRRRARRLSLLLRGLAGIRPREVDPAEVQACLDETSDPRDRLALWLMSMHIALDRDALDEAARAAREVAELHQRFPDGMRQMVALDLAWFFGRYGRDAAAAAHWIGLSRGGFVDPFQRPLAEAGLAWAEGRLEDARRAITHTRRLLPRAMDTGTAAAVAEQLDALERDLGSAATRSSQHLTPGPAAPFARPGN